MTQDEIIEMAREAGFMMENSAAIQAAEIFAKLVAASPQRTWVGLTAGEILDTLISVDEKTVRLPSMLGQFACAIEAKLKEKNTRQDGDCKHCVNGCPACDARRQSNVLP